MTWRKRFPRRHQVQPTDDVFGNSGAPRVIEGKDPEILGKFVDRVLEQLLNLTLGSGAFGVWSRGIDR
jgi:hypothetical protein